MICSTTTFAFNRYSSKYIANSFGEMADILFGMPKINKALKRLRPLGYDVKNAMSIVQNDNDTDTIVYTSKSFQPYAEKQKAVAKRAGEMGAGFLLENSTASEIRAAVERVLDDEHYRINAEKIREDLRSCKGAVGAAEFIEEVIDRE